MVRARVCVCVCVEGINECVDKKDMVLFVRIVILQDNTLTTAVFFILPFVLLFIIMYIK